MAVLFFVTATLTEGLMCIRLEIARGKACKQIFNTHEYEYAQTQQRGLELQSKAGIHAAGTGDSMMPELSVAQTGMRDEVQVSK